MRTIIFPNKGVPGTAGQAILHQKRQLDLEVPKAVFFYYMKHPLWGTSILGNLHIYIYIYDYIYMIIYIYIWLYIYIYMITYIYIYIYIYDCIYYIHYKLMEVEFFFFRGNRTIRSMTGWSSSRVGHSRRTLTMIYHEHWTWYTILYM